MTQLDEWDYFNMVRKSRPATHTPKPWRLSSRKEGYYRIYGDGEIIATVEAIIDRDQVSPNTFKEKIAEANANANLITVAPVLLAELRFFLDASGSELVKECYPAHTADAYAAIAQATIKE